MEYGHGYTKAISHIWLFWWSVCTLGTHMNKTMHEKAKILNIRLYRIVVCYTQIHPAKKQKRTSGRSRYKSILLFEFRYFTICHLPICYRNRSILPYFVYFVFSHRLCHLPQYNIFSSRLVTHECSAHFCYCISPMQR